MLVIWDEMMKQSHPVISALNGGFKAGSTIQWAKKELKSTNTSSQNPESLSITLRFRKYNGNKIPLMRL